MQVLPNVKRLIRPRGHVRQQLDSFSLCCPSRASFLTASTAQQRRPWQRAAARRLSGTDKRTRSVWLQRGATTPCTSAVPQRLRPEPDGSRLERVARAVDPTTYRYQPRSTRRNAAPFCATPQPVLPDRRHRQGTRSSGAAPHRGLSSCGWRSRRPFRCAARARRSAAARHTGSGAAHQPAERTPMPMPPSFNEADVSDKPQVIKRRALFNARRIAAIQENWRQRRDPDAGRGDHVDRRDAEADRRARQHPHPLPPTTASSTASTASQREGALVRTVYPPAADDALDGEPDAAARRARSQLTMNDDTETILDVAGVRAGRTEDGVSLLPSGDRVGERPRPADRQPARSRSLDGIRTASFR